MIGILYKLGIISVLIIAFILITKLFLTYTFPEREININEKVKIGGMYQWIMAQGESKDLPLLLWLHGGPGASQMPVARYFNHNLEEEFIVVHWDQRGAGKSNPADFDQSTMTVEQFINDLHELTQYLKKEFNKDRIYLLGHSWGTQLGMIAAYRYPEDYIAYIGVGQVAHHHQAHKLAYDELRNRVLENGNKKDLEKLELLPEPPYIEHEDYISFVRLMSHYNMNVDVKMGKLLRVALFSGVYNPGDFQKWYRGANRGSGPMWEESQGWDILQKTPDIKIPCYFISGEIDFNTPAVLVNEMLKQPGAPAISEHYIINNTAHTPFLGNPEKFLAILKKIKEKNGSHITFNGPIKDETIIIEITAYEPIQNHPLPRIKDCQY